MSLDPDLMTRLDRIAAALERIAPPVPPAPNFEAAEAFVWLTEPEGFLPVAHVNRVPLKLLQGVDRAAAQLLDNTRRFASGLPANNALLWGARGMGKSSLVKAAHAEVRSESKLGKAGADLKLVEIHREDIASLPRCLGHIRASRHRFIVFCDDLSFDRDDTSYKSLKAVLEGGIEGPPRQRAVLRDVQPPPPDAARHGRERAFDRHQPVRGGRGKGLAVRPLRPLARLPQRHARTSISTWSAPMRPTTSSTWPTPISLRDALEWSMTRGGRSGRVAWQYIQDLAGRLGKELRED